jgi:hypothetical protein
MSPNISPIVSEVTNFRALQEFVMENEGSLVELTKRYYITLGNDLGFKCEVPFSTEVNGCNVELDIAWLDESNLEVAFEFEFGTIDEMLAGIAKLTLINPELAVLITSAKARIANLDKIASIIKELSPYSENFLIVDLAEERYLLL